MAWMREAPIFRGWPVDMDQCRITGKFAATHPPWGPTNPHRGLDIAPAPPFTDLPITLWAPARCVKVLTPEVSTFGNAPVFDFGPQYRFRWGVFAHCRRVLVAPGMDVDAGTVVGKTGSTGLSTGEHVHQQQAEDIFFSRDIRRNTDPEALIEEEPMPPFTTPDQVRAIITEWSHSPDFAQAVLAVLTEWSQSRAFAEAVLMALWMNGYGITTERLNEVDQDRLMAIRTGALSDAAAVKQVADFIRDNGLDPQED